MRTPTPHSVLYAWHGTRLAAIVEGFADVVAPFTNDPQCGFYKRTLVKGGPFVPARIFIERDIDPETGELASDEVMACEVNGTRRDPEDEWQWLWSNPISEADFNYMTAVVSHAAWHDPAAPEANPRKPIDWLTVKPPSFG